MIKRVLVPIAHGTEELEAVTIMSRGVIVQADCHV